MRETSKTNETAQLGKGEQLFSNCADLERELKVTEQLLAERQKVLDAVPECKTHGSCVPHAIEWIEEMKAKHCC